MIPVRPIAGHLRVAQAHPVGDRRRFALAAGEWEYSLLVRGVVAGVGLAAFFLALPFVGVVLCAALGLDPMGAIAP